MDYIALSGANFFLKRRKRVYRLFLAAFLASVGSLMMTIWVPDKQTRLIFVHFILNTGMVWVGFGYHGRREFFENWALIYFMALLLGGLMEWEHEGAFLHQNFFLQALAAAAVLTGVTVYLGRRKNFGNQILPAELKNKGKVLKVKAYWDSGNQLTDPYVGKPVCILERQKAGFLFHEEQDRVRLIPYSSLGNAEGLLPVCNADMLCIFDNQRKIEIAPVVVGIAEKGLLEKKEYDLILHASMLEHIKKRKGEEKCL